MEANELRIGNWITKKGMINDNGSMREAFIDVKVDIYILGEMLNGNKLGMYSPTELTEDILVKAGFKKRQPTFKNVSLPYWVNNRVCLFFNSSPPENTYMIGWGETIDGGEYVCAHGRWITDLHELQNCYRFFTGKELTIEL